MTDLKVLASSIDGFWDIEVAGTQQARNGDIHGTVSLANGSTAYCDKAILNTPQGRAAWAREAATGEGRPSVDVLEAELLRLVPNIQAQLQERSKPSPSEVLADVLGATGVTVFHDPDETLWARVRSGKVNETWKLESKKFERWFAGEAARREGKVPSTNHIKETIAVLAAQALEGPEHTVHTRVAEHDGRVYLDLANKQREVVEIGPAEWRIIDDPPVYFQRTRGMRPLPQPVRGGTLADLQRFVNVRDDDDWILLCSVLVGALAPRGPYTPLAIHGENGSAKTTTARIFRALIDPHGLPVRSGPREERDLMIAATNGWLVAFDNLSHLPQWLSDALCRLATGGGFATRQLYTNDEEALFEAQRPAIMTGIEELATREDLLARSVILYLRSISEDDRRPERQFWADFERHRPLFFGALLDAVSCALRNYKDTERALQHLPRMADFAIWASAAAPALGWTRERFIAAYAKNRASANELTLEASIIVEPLRALMSERSEWRGTAAELLADTATHAGDSAKEQRNWPKNPKGMSDALRRITASLRATGLLVEFPPRSKNRREIVIQNTQYEGQ